MRRGRRKTQSRRKCTVGGHSKVIYPNKGDAVSTATRVLGKKGNTSATALRVYHCPRCKGYHLTKQLDG